MRSEPGASIGKATARPERTAISGLARTMARTMAVLILTATPTLAAGPLETTSPGHMPPVPPGGYELPLSPPVVRFPLPPQWVTIQSQEDWRKSGAKVNKKLSAACALGRFSELLPLRYRAVFRRDVFGVAFGHGLNLSDPDRLARRDMIYLFRDGDSTNCMVAEMTNRDARVLAEAGGGGGDGDGQDELAEQARANRRPPAYPPR